MNDEELRNHTGRRLREERLKAGLTQAEVAVYLGVGAPHISKVENGRERPSEVTVRRYAELLHLDLDSLLIELGYAPLKAWARIQDLEERLRQQEGEVATREVGSE